MYDRFSTEICEQKMNYSIVGALEVGIHIFFKMIMDSFFTFHTKNCSKWI